MEKRYFWAIQIDKPAKLHRFPSKLNRADWIKVDSENRGEVGQNHPAFFMVRRFNRMLAKGEQITFPVNLEGI